MTVSTIILAAGKGTRMKSPTPKILHKIAGKQLIAFSLDLAKAVKSKETVVVIGEETEEVTRKALERHQKDSKLIREIQWKVIRISLQPTR